MAKVGRLIKELAVKELTTTLNERSNFFVASIGPVTSVETDAFRKRLRASRASLVTVKRTLGLRSLAALKLDEVKPLFDGSIALVLPGDDLIPAAKLLVEFAKSNEEKIAVRGGWVDGQLLDKRRLEALAGLPPRLQLLAELIAALESPMTGLIMTVESVLGELVQVIEEAGKKAPAAPATPAAATPESTSSTPPTPLTQQQEGTTNG